MRYSLIVVFTENVCMISQGVHEGTYRFVYSWTTDIEWTSQQLQEFSYSLYIYTQYLFVLLETSVFDIRFKKHVLVNSLHAAFLLLQ